jgi:hypothetical protein
MLTDLSGVGQAGVAEMEDRCGRHPVDGDVALPFQPAWFEPDQAAGG